MTAALRLLLVRHGQSEANAERHMQGRLDSKLTATGRQQAVAIARRIAASGPLDGLYSSPLARAFETAQAICEATGVKPVVLDDLMENDIGAAMGLSWEEFGVRFPREAEQIRDGAPDACWPGGESHAELAERVGSVMDFITSRHSTGAVAVVSHGGLLRWAVAHLMAGTEFGHPNHRFDNCAITEVTLGPEGRSIACANDVTHLAEIESEEAHSG